jgi:membrane-bound serine protease (ClpP class)
MMYAWPVALQLLAFAVLFAEVLIPSFGVLSVIALGLGAWSWYFILAELPAGAKIAFAVADIILVPTAVRFAFRYLGRSPVSHRTDVGVGSGLEDLSRGLAAHVGRAAVAESFLRPSGKLRLDGVVFEARTAGEFVDKGAAVRIIAVDGGGFLVEKTKQEQPS